MGRGWAAFSWPGSATRSWRRRLPRGVFLAVVRHIDQLRGSAAGWLWAIVRNELARHYRDRGHRGMPADLPARDGLPADQAARRENQVLLQTALARLTDEQQQIVSMKFFLQMRTATSPTRWGSRRPTWGCCFIAH